MKRDSGRERVSVFAPVKFRALAVSERRSISNLAFKVLSDFVEQRSAAPQSDKQSHISSNPRSRVE